MPRKEYHEGIVRDNNDPQKRGRLLVESPTIVSGETLDWAEPKFPFVDSHESAGWFFLPSVGSSVTVEIEAEDDSEANGLGPKWECDLYPEGTVPEEFQENYPERRGLKTKSGHILMFDDTEDQLTFTYRHPSGTEIFVNNDGRIELKPAAGQSVFVGEDADQFLMRGGNTMDYLRDIRSAFNLHTHVETGPVTETPSTSFADPPDSLLSEYHKVK